MTIVVIGAVLAYLIGSVSFALLAGKLQGVDVRSHGSGNLGATNAGRVLGRSTGIAIFVLDSLKGFAPAFWFPHVAAARGGTMLSPTSLGLLFGGCAIVGHVFPFYLGFKGGKGVATGAGVFLALAPVATAAALVVWAISILIWRMMSLASILAAIALPVAAAFFVPRADATAVCSAAVAIAVLVVVRHRSNIRRIVAGTEKRIGEGNG
ncbi:MAG: glycerol-3-phosphate 1-O-acyltransferase PlsY [Planctomycetes bacterium]|nr:glycerol-3-phosphate 1-O-acyltransferase PlsY [Planctomycetota bacterium]MBI3843857.1 glycerol-3-phosphate 1-O-acyltransferase PlsY [Planctomycetota bacterium]